eukprot:scaffold96297_cov53-Attheya_sp.AAC.3
MSSLGADPAPERSFFLSDIRVSVLRLEREQFLETVVPSSYGFLVDDPVKSNAVQCILSFLAELCRPLSLETYFVLSSLRHDPLSEGPTSSWHIEMTIDLLKGQQFRQSMIPNDIFRRCCHIML